jgi:hypothetical protein
MVRIMSIRRIQGCGTRRLVLRQRAPLEYHPDQRAMLGRIDDTAVIGQYPSPRPYQSAAVLGALKVRPGNTEQVSRTVCRPTLTAPVPAGVSILRSGRGKARGAVEPEK